MPMSNAIVIKAVLLLAISIVLYSSIDEILINIYFLINNHWSHAHGRQRTMKYLAVGGEGMRVAGEVLTLSKYHHHQK